MSAVGDPSIAVVTGASGGIGSAIARRLATPDDVAAAVSAAVHDLPLTTGAVIPVDGGRPLGTR